MSGNSGTFRSIPGTLSDSADLALAHRSAGAKPGTRGPHTNLFQGGLPMMKSEPRKRETVAERVGNYTVARKMSEAQAAVFGVIASHVLEHGSSLTDDGFLVAQNANVPYEEFNVIRERLMGAGYIRMRAVGTIGVDGFDLGVGISL